MNANLKIKTFLLIGSLLLSYFVLMHWANKVIEKVEDNRLKEMDPREIVLVGSRGAVRRAFLKLGFDPNSAVCENRLLYYAIQRDNPEVIAILIEAGARMDVVNMDGLSPLEYARKINADKNVINLLESQNKK